MLKIDSESTAYSISVGTQPRRTREDLVRDLRKSFGEDARHPNVAIYRQLPVLQLKQFACTGSTLRTQETQAMLLGYGSLLTSGVAFASNFKEAAAGLLVLTAAAGLDFYRSHKDHQRLQREVLDFAKK